MNILVIRLSSMGDVILASAVFGALAEKYPAAAISLVTNADYAGMFAADRRLQRVFAYSRSSPTGPLSAEIKAIHWDRIVDLQNNRRSQRLIAELNPDALVTKFDKMHRQRALLLLCRVNVYDARRTVLHRYLETALGQAPAAGDEERFVPRLMLPQDAVVPGLELPDDAPPAMPMLALMPFCAWRNKQWPLSNFEAVGRHFLQLGWQVLILGGPADHSAAEALGGRLGRGAISLTGKIQLHQTAAALARCSLALGGDTGLSHLARAVGVKTCMIFGATARHFGFFPQGSPPFAVLERNEWCRPCHPHGGNSCLRLGRRPCLELITADDAIKALTALARHD